MPFYDRTARTPDGPEKVFWYVYLDDPVYTIYYVHRAATLWSKKCSPLYKLIQKYYIGRQLYEVKKCANTVPAPSPQWFRLPPSCRRTRRTTGATSRRSCGPSRCCSLGKEKHEIWVKNVAGMYLIKKIMYRMYCSYIKTLRTPGMRNLGMFWQSH